MAEGTPGIDPVAQRQLADVINRHPGRLDPHRPALPLSPAESKHLANRAFRQARWHRDTVLAALDQLRVSLGLLPDGLLADLVRRGYGTVERDGFRSGGLVERVAGSGGDIGLTSVEGAAEARIWGDDSFDPAGLAICRLFELLHEWSVESCEIDRLVPYLLHCGVSAKGGMSLSDRSAVKGDCVGCGRWVPGSEEDRLRVGLCDRCRASNCQCCDRKVSGDGGDRLRSGLCDACRKALERAQDRGAAPVDPVSGMVDRRAWMEVRRADLRDMPDESRARVLQVPDARVPGEVAVAVAEGSAVTGGFRQGDGEWRAS